MKKTNWLFMSLILLAFAGLLMTGCDNGSTSSSKKSGGTRNVGWSALPDGSDDGSGKTGDVTSENIVITFDKAVTLVTGMYVSVAGNAKLKTGSGVEWTSNTAKTEWTIPIETLYSGPATVTITQTSSWKQAVQKTVTVTVWKAGDTIRTDYDVTADGQAGITTTQLTLEFGEEVELDIEDIALTPFGRADKLALSSDGGTTEDKIWILDVFVTEAGIVTVTITNNAITAVGKNVQVFFKPLSADDYDTSAIDVTDSEPASGDPDSIFVKISGDDFDDIVSAGRGSYLLIMVDVSQHPNSGAEAGWGIGAVGNWEAGSPPKWNSKYNFGFSWPAGGTRTEPVAVKVDVKAALEYLNSGDDFLLVNTYEKCTVESITLFSIKVAEPDPVLGLGVKRLITIPRDDPLGKGNFGYIDVKAIAEADDTDVLRFYFSNLRTSAGGFGVLAEGWSGGFPFNTSDVPEGVLPQGTSGGTGTGGTDYIFNLSVGCFKAWLNRGSSPWNEENLILNLYNNVSLARLELCEAGSLVCLDPEVPFVLGGNLGSFGESDGNQKKGWMIPVGRFTDAKYLVLETEATGDTGFGGFEIALQSDVDGWDWHQTDLEQVTFSRTGTNPIHIVIQLDQLDSYIAVTATTGNVKLMICYYDDDIFDLNLKKADLINGDLETPVDAVQLKDSASKAYGYVTAQLDFGITPPTLPVLFNGVWLPAMGAVTDDSELGESVFEFANGVDVSGYVSLSIKFRDTFDPNNYVAGSIGGNAGGTGEWKEVSDWYPGWTIVGKTATLELGEVDWIKKIVFKGNNDPTISDVETIRLNAAPSSTLPDDVVEMGVATAAYPYSDWAEGFTTGGGESYQRGWELNGGFFTDNGIPTHIVLQSAAGGDGLAGLGVIFQPDWEQTSVTPDWSFDGTWAATATTLIVDLRECNAYGDIFVSGVDWAKIILTLPQAHQFVAGSSLIGAYLIFDSDLGDAIVADGTLVTGGKAYYLKDFNWGDYN